MENVVYNELRRNGFRVDVGQVRTKTSNTQGATIRKTLEVDFVANKGDQRIYIQSAYSIPEEAKQAQEAASLLKIGDGFKRMIVVNDDVYPHWDVNGIYNVGLIDFLLDSTQYLTGCP